MAGFFPKRAFREKDGKTLYFRGRYGPVYEVTEEEKAGILEVSRRLHRKMALIILLSFASFGLVIVFLPQILDLSFELAMLLMIGLVAASLGPLWLTLRFHLTQQTQIREILGKKTATDLHMDIKTTKPASEKKPETQAPKQSREPRLMDIVRQRERKVRFFWVFFLGVIIFTVGITVLAGLENPTAKDMFVWTALTMTGAGFLIAGSIGIYYRLADRRSGERKLRD